MKDKKLLMVIALVNIIFFITLISCKSKQLNVLDKRIEYSLRKSSLLLETNTKNSISSLQPFFAKSPKIGRYVNNEIESVTEKIDSSISILETYLTKKEEHYSKTDSVIELEKYVNQKYDSIVVFMAYYAKLTKEEITEKTKRFRKKIERTSFPDPFSNEKIALSILQDINDLRILENIFVDAIGVLIPVRTPSYTKYYPIVLPECKTIKKGDLFKAEIVIGNLIINKMYKYSLKINEQPYILKGNKIFFEEITDGKIGKNKLDLELSLIIPYTEEKITTKSEFIYNVIE